MFVLIWSSIPLFKGHKSMSSSSILFWLTYKEIALVSGIKSFHFEQEPDPLFSVVSELRAQRDNGKRWHPRDR